MLIYIEIVQVKNQPMVCRRINKYQNRLIDQKNILLIYFNAVFLMPNA